MSFLSVVAAISLVSLCHAGTVHISDCMRTNNQRNPENLVHVNTASANPFPVVIPGDVDIVGNLDLYKNLTGQLSMSVSIKRKVLGLWVPVPCVSNVGSCQYADLCDMLSSNFMENGVPNCPPQLVAEGLPCTCPIPAGHYAINHGHFTIPELSGVWSFLAKGDYQLRATLTDKSRNAQVACHSMDLSIGSKCSFFDCLFG
ncbi:ganglioside GM2 activator-like [Argopecten irradians]|uniref:ganglioside GM2 activator-like n=1 Tax=Argopecten irradians TaxID=31199 RepID=UPI00371E2A14